MAKSSHKFGRLLAEKPGQTNNHPAARAAKADIRRKVMAELGADHVHVFDAFAGDGAMYREVWNEAAGYVGCDLEWYRDERTAFVANNLRVLRAIDLAAFNVFDFDAYGSPWEQAVILAARRGVKPGERLGLILTEGSGLNLKMGGYPGALRLLAGLRGKPAGGAKNHMGLVDRAINGFCRKMGVRPIRRWQATGRTGARVHYIGLVLEAV